MRLFDLMRRQIKSVRKLKGVPQFSYNFGFILSIWLLSKYMLRTTACLVRPQKLNETKSHMYFQNLWGKSASLNNYFLLWTTHSFTNFTYFHICNFGFHDFNHHFGTDTMTNQNNFLIWRNMSFDKINFLLNCWFQIE